MKTVKIRWWLGATPPDLLSRRSQDPKFASLAKTWGPHQARQFMQNVGGVQRSGARTFTGELKIIKSFQRLGGLPPRFPMVDLEANKAAFLSKIALYVFILSIFCYFLGNFDPETKDLR